MCLIKNKMGDNFGLNDNYEYTEYWLDSLDNSGSYSGNASATDWPLFQFGNISLDNLVAIKVLEWQIPFSYYIFTTVNQNFILNETGYTTQTVTIPVGNYTAVQLATVLATALTTASALSGSGNTWTVTYSPNTQKFTFTSSTTQFSFTFGTGYNQVDSNGFSIPPNSGNRNPRLWIGFPPGVTSSVANVIVSPNADLVSGPNYLYINSRTIGSGVHGYLPAGATNLGGGVSGPQLAKITVNVNSSGVIVGQDPSPLMWFFRDSHQAFTSCDFYLTLGNLGGGNTTYPLQLNGLSFSIKVGMLLRQMNDSTSHIGNYQNGRVTESFGPKKRTRNLF